MGLGKKYAAGGGCRKFKSQGNECFSKNIKCRVRLVIK